MPDVSPTILLVDDEDAVRKVLAFPLEKDGYSVVQAGDGEEALRLFASQAVDLVVLDVMLPRLDGLEVCKRLRATSTVPIIMLTARDDELDKVLGLELGADDYITKPFSIREFRSRVRALLRRARAPHVPGTEDERIEVDGLVVDVPRRTVEVRGEPVQLTYVEFELLRTLAAAPGRVFSRRMLLEALWKSADYRDPRTIDVHVRHLREKLEAEPRHTRVHPHRARRRLPLPRQMSPFRSVGGRLALALLVIVVGALVIVYLIVVPSYQRSLENAELRGLANSLVHDAVPKFPTDPNPSALQQYAGDLQPAVNAQVAVFNSIVSKGALEPQADSEGGQDSSLLERDSVALRARDGSTLARGTVSRGNQRFAEVAYPLNGYVILFSAPLHDQLQTVAGWCAGGSSSPVRSRRCLPFSSATGAQRSSRGGSSASKRRQSASPLGTSPSRWSTRSTTRSASSRGPSSGCG